MSERPRTRLLNGTALTILKWIGGVTAAVIGSLVVIVIMGTARAVVSNDRRIAVVESEAAGHDRALDRIERKLDSLIEFNRGRRR